MQYLRERILKKYKHVSHKHFEQNIFHAYTVGFGNQCDYYVPNTKRRRGWTWELGYVRGVRKASAVNTQFIIPAEAVRTPLLYPISSGSSHVGVFFQYQKLLKSGFLIFGRLVNKI